MIQNGRFFSERQDFAIVAVDLAKAGCNFVLLNYYIMQEEGLLQTKLSQFTWSSEASTIASIFVFTVISTIFSEVAPLWA